MLHRAANKAYSWWWASHIRTKQSKWLEENLHDMEDRVDYMLKIIEDDGDSFAKRAEMYYKKRPELINSVQETFRAYRALAERYDHLSKDLQSANRTIASVFPEQVQFAMDDEDDENFSRMSTSSPSPDRPPLPKSGVPKVPFPKKEFKNSPTLLSRRGQLRKTPSSARVATLPSSGLSKDEALEEIDKLQKEILAMQTEKEFIRSSYERGCEKYWETESQINEKQKKDALVKLQEEQQQSAKEAREESKRVTEAQKKFQAIRRRFLPKSEQLEEDESDSVGSESENLDREIDNWEKEKHDLVLLRKKIKEQLELNSNSSLTMSQLADNIDDLVQRVVNLETEVFSQNGMVKRLRSETDGLQSHVRNLEEDKEALVECSDIMRAKMTELEEELSRVKDLVKTVIEQNNNLKTQFTEEDRVAADAKAGKGIKDQGDGLAPGGSSMALKGKENQKGEEKKYVLAELDVMPEKPQEPREEDKVEKKDLSETASRTLESNAEELGTDEEDNQPNWGQLFSNGLDDREKILLEEYTSVLRDYKDVKMKLNEVEQKNRDGFFELALQIRELKSAVASRDGEIQSLRQQMNSPHKILDEDQESSVTRQEGISHTASMANSTFSSPTSHHERRGSSTKEEEKEMEDRTMTKTKPVPSRPVSAVEEKLRSDIDGLLEENLEFWLRFSTCFHQIQKYEASVQDLNAELLKMRENKHTNLKSLASDARPIFMHLREVQTELTLWQENNAVLKDELKGRYSSMCNIQEEISRLTSAGSRAEDAELSQYQAAKFQGEILNMKQENNKVCDELKAGFARVRQLKVEVERAMEKLDEDYGITSSTNQRPGRSARARIPLRSFLFGAKLKGKKHSRTPSMFSCMSPALNKQYSFIGAPIEPPE
ncbi:hypothetical protein SLEP1_g42060 [Rubroshorea leprosula]|uniref:NAB domain-containing protein n=1 Tax=Rubroshorea leprosula TaxID=152421 RepID=A0AAV5L8J6_9ROSI|nr:hypothetical protein SLEP1_g42060 [Rubroshorea leprosula]